VLTLGLVALAAAEGCKQKQPEPIPGPKAHGGSCERGWDLLGSRGAWMRLCSAWRACDVQCRTAADGTCGAGASRPRNRVNVAAPAVCHSGTCPAAAAPAQRRPLV